MVSRKTLLLTALWILGAAAALAWYLHGCTLMWETNKHWEDEDHAAGRVAQLYGGYVIPGSTWADLHLVVSQWNTRTNWPYKSMHFRTDLSCLRPAAHDDHGVGHGQTR